MSTLLDRHTVEAVYRRYGAQVERRCRELLPDPDEAADAVHEVFMKLFTKGGTFRAESDWMTWLHRVSTNVCLNHIRNTRHRRRLLERHGDAVRPRELFDPARLGERDALLAILSKMSRKMQRIVVYHYFQDKSQQEIAKLMGTSRQTVNRYLREFEKRARHYLRH